MNKQRVTFIVQLNDRSTSFEKMLCSAQRKTTRVTFADIVNLNEKKSCEKHLLFSFLTHAPSKIFCAADKNHAGSNN